jgi:hypothetical protein
MTSCPRITSYRRSVLGFDASFQVWKLSVVRNVFRTSSKIIQSCHISSYQCNGIDVCSDTYLFFYSQSSLYHGNDHNGSGHEYLYTTNIVVHDLRCRHNLFYLAFRQRPFSLILSIISSLSFASSIRAKLNPYFKRFPTFKLNHFLRVLIAPYQFPTDLS